jgi:hypothetical protein
MINKIMTRNMESLENSARIHGEFRLNSRGNSRRIHKQGRIRPLLGDGATVRFFRTVRNQLGTNLKN